MFISGLEKNISESNKFLTGSKVVETTYEINKNRFNLNFKCFTCNLDKYINQFVIFILSYMKISKQIVIPFCELG